jgi:DNA mismatch repair ATPase MutL
MPAAIAPLSASDALALDSASHLSSLPALLAELLSNAVHAGARELTAAVSLDGASIELADDGSGVAPALLRHLRGARK